MPKFAFAPSMASTCSSIFPGTFHRNVPGEGVLDAGILHGNFRLHLAVSNYPRHHVNLVGIPQTVRLDGASAGHSDRARTSNGDSALIFASVCGASGLTIKP